ncbi:uncharacterized protein LOC126887018 [Diabrotica virgifera virgifera]|uniref:Uncharacterized protein LOC114338371 n=1 Tax=Diabrotica virgifera virgifera TaxID=50390 RepID=A0A6P7G6R8_DIAVI|nr:uncharacterized protein LOC126887018 [Diabrotica virgifera virgifera]
MFDTAKFIKEVEKRPALYNQFRKEYLNRELKLQLWEEICAKMYDKWEDASEELKSKLQRELQTKWKSIRDHFKRQVDIENGIAKCGQAAKFKRRYLYYDLLHFLKPHMRSRGTLRSIDTSEQQTEDPLSEVEDTESVDFMPQLIKIEEEPFSFEKSSKRRYSTDEYEMREVQGDSSQSMMLQNHEGDEDFMGNKAFLMSLLPLLNTVPANELVSFRCKVMEVFQTIDFS